MITKKDALDYLTQIYFTEMKMKAGYIKLSKNLVDEELIHLFDSMQREEQEHADLASKLKKIVEDSWSV